MITPILAILAISLLGFIAQRLGICLVRATREALQGSAWFLFAILLSGLWVWVYSGLALYNDWVYPLQRFEFHPIFLAGGFVFGVGASINQGCSVSTMNFLARGNLAMLFTMLGWFLGWCLWASLTMAELVAINYQGAEALELKQVLSFVAPMLLVTFGVIMFSPSQRRRWIGILVIGCLAGVLYYVEPAWAPSRLIQDSVAATLHNQPYPSIFRFSLVAALLGGMFVAVWLNANVQLRWPKWPKILRHLSAGTLMGLGASMALGGNDAQLMMGLPAGSIGGMAALLAMIAGIATEQLLFQRGLQRA